MTKNTFVVTVLQVVYIGRRIWCCVESSTAKTLLHSIQLRDAVLVCSFAFVKIEMALCDCQRVSEIVFRAT